MIEAPPRIDPRNQEILVKELRKLLLNYCPEWNDASIGTDKRANAMLYIFSRMMETIIQRLNKVPEKNFMTFLDLMGVRMSPPRIARAALTFKMVAGAKQYGSIPAGSQVATEKTKEEDSTVFETENDLTAILPGISRAVSISPVDDSFEEHSAFLFSNEKKEVELFKGKKLIPHRLYIGHNELFALKEISDITLTIAIVDDIKEKKINYNYKIPDEWEVKWYYFDENSNPAPLIPESNDPFITNLLKSGPIIFKNAVGISEKTLDGIYLFNWDKIPGNDNDRLLEFLRQKFYIDTAMTAKIEKINGGNVIRIITERNRISLKLGIDKIKVSIDIDDGRTDELMAKIENNTLKIYGGITTNWIFAELNSPIPEKSLPEIASINVSLNIPVTEANILLPEKAFFNTFPLDLTRDFYPFGNKPKFNDTFYIGSKEVFSKENANIFIKVQLSESVDQPDSINIVLLWEFWGKKGWMKIAKTTSNGIQPPVYYNFNDSTNAFTVKETSSELIEYKVHEVNQNNYVEKGLDIKGNKVSGLAGTHYRKVEWNDETYVAINGNPNKLAKLVFEQGISYGEKKILTVGETWDIGEGWSITVQAIDARKTPGEVWLLLNKDGLKKDEKVLTEKKVFTYIEKSMSGESDVPIFVTYVDTIFSGMVADLIQLKYTWAVDTNVIEKEDRDVEVRFTCPKIEASEINGEKNHWVRVRIIGGNYGDEATYREQTEIGKYEVVTVNGIKKKKVNNILEDLINDEKTEWIYVPPTYKPPSLSKFSLRYNFDKGADPKSILIYNDFAHEHVIGINEIPFKPFKPSSDKEPALYIGFDGNISTLPVTIFFPLIGNAVTGARTISLAFGDKGPGSTGAEVILRDISDLQKGDIIEFQDKLRRKETRTITRIDSNTKTIFWNGGLLYDFSGEGSSITVLPNPPLLSWEYWTGKTWSFLSLVDKTNNLRKREMVQFLAPFDLTKRTCFGEEFYWIRGRLEKGNYDKYPKLKGIYTNTVWAYNRITGENEILGSSSGKPGQILNLSRYPVLPGQELFINELSLTEDEKNTIIKEEGKDAVSEIIDEAGNVRGLIVRWHEVGHFYFSRPGSRHYMIDRNSGSIIFGDGLRGMIPQGGKDNIKCNYRSGGGVKGNVKAGKIIKPRTSFPYIDSVTNVDASDGGGDVEDTNRLRERGPQTLKHGDRAVTPEDFLWLVREASPKVAKVKCLPTTSPDQNYKPGWITLIVVPDTEDIKPLPTEELINNIQEYLFQRTSTFLIPASQINIIGPGYIKVEVNASVQFTSITEAKTIEGKIVDNLTKFFHPLRGGTEEKGWEFGRDVYISEVYEVIENTPGVDHVEKLSLNASMQIYKLNFNTIKPSVDYPSHSIVSVGKKYLFDWDEIPGDDSNKFRQFLIQDFGVSWIKNEDINKIDNNNAILLSGDNRSVLLRFDSEKRRAILTIDNIWTDEFIVMIEDGKQKIFDRSIFSLADGLSQEETDTFTVTGFKEGDNIILRNGGKRDTLVIRSVAHDTTGDILECEPFNTKNEYTPGSIVETSDKKIRSFTLTNVPANSNNSLLKVAIIEKGETIILGLKDDPSRTDAIEITEVDDRVEKIFIDDNYLVYSGTHSINRNSINNNNSKNNNEDNKLLFPFLVNINSKEIHNLDNIKKNCNLDYIKNDHKKFIKTLDNINGYDYCGWCFGAGMSKR